MTGELGQREWKVLDVRTGDVEDNPNGPGQLQKFYVDFEGSPDVYWRRKLPATVEKGNSYFGTISEGKFGPMFKKETPGQDGAPSSGSERSSGSAGGKRDWQPEAERDPERAARILRQHSQSCAVQVLTAMGVFEGKSADQMHTRIREWTNWFDADVNQAGRAARAEQGDSVGGLAQQKSASIALDSSPAPLSPPADLSHQEIGEALDTAGLVYAPARDVVISYMVSQLSEADRTRAVKQLADAQDSAAQGQTLRAMQQRTEAWKGEPLPQGDALDGTDDVPF